LPYNLEVLGSRPNIREEKLCYGTKTLKFSLYICDILDASSHNFIKLLFNGVVKSLMTTLVHVVKSIARGAAPALATHHVNA
jgi:hypothetical protein